MIWLKRAVVAALFACVVLQPPAEPTPDRPGALALVAACVSPRFGALCFVPRAASGPAELGLTLLSPLAGAVATSLADAWPTRFPLLFAALCARVAADAAFARIRRQCVRAAVRWALAAFRAPNPADSVAQLRLLCGADAAVAAASAPALRRARSTLNRAADAIEDALLAGDLTSQQRQRQQQQQAEETCAVCMCDPACVVLKPCLHKVLCRECFETLCRERETTLCPLCRVPFLGHCFDDSCDGDSSCFCAHFAVARPQSPTAFEREGAEFTKRELQRAGLWRAHKAFLASIPESAL